MESGEAAWFWRWVSSGLDAADGVAAVPIFVKQGACVCGHGYAAGECDYVECAHESAVEALTRASGEFVEHGQERAQPEELQVFEHKLPFAGNGYVGGRLTASASDVSA